MTARVPFGRRELLAGGLGLLALSGCSTITHLTGPRPTPRVPATFSDLLGNDPFYVAHRGGGENWPEMTAYAYEQAAQLPYVKAIEISVCLSADGVLVCSHDANTARVTGVDLDIGNTDWDQLSRLKVVADHTDTPIQPARPFSRFDEVIEQHLPNLVVFVEPKVPEAVAPLMARMKQLDQPERTVWKQPINQLNFGTAKANGFHTWGYVLNEPGHLGERLPRFAADPTIDMLGIQKTAVDDIVNRVVGLASQNGKPTMMWAIERVPERTRGLSLGCRGMMTSNIVGVPPIPL